LKNNNTEAHLRTDYVPTAHEVRLLKEGMIADAEKLREERKLNEDLVPDNNAMEKELSIVKD
jgi:hypothetical protein